MSFSKLMTLGQLKAIGVKDDRWTVQDKLVMYKGLIRIFSREQKNQIKDTNVLKKKNFKKISALQKEIRELHTQVANRIYADRNLLRRLLLGHKELQLMYMNMSLDKVIEDLNHRIFCKKKNLNIIHHKKSQKEDLLFRTKINLSELQDIVNTPDFSRTDLKQQAITNAIHNYDVRFCAAKNIQTVYKRMLTVLLKDQRYYESVLVTLQNDSNIQHKCLIRATEMGQLAMEEMANMKYEYYRLEKEVRNNMNERENCLKEIRDRLDDLHEETQGLVRTESEFDIQMIQGAAEEPKKKGKDLQEEIEELSRILTKMQEVTLVINIRSILPRMLDTLRQKKRLLEELRMNAAACDELLEKRNHAELMLYSLLHSGAENELKCRSEVNDLKTKIEEQKVRLEKLLVEQDVLSNISVKLRGGLQRLCQILSDVKTPMEYKDISVIPWPVSNKAESLRPVPVEQEEEEMEEPLPPINEEALRLIHLLDAKMKFIKLRLKETGDKAEKERAFVSHFRYVSEFMSSNLFPTEVVKEPPSLIVDVVVEDSQIPNRTEIKARSLEIYTEATRNPFEAMEGKNKKLGRKIK